MARRRREEEESPAQTPLYLGFFGTGTTSTKNIEALLDSVINGAEKVTFAVPATQDQYTETIATIVEYADNVNDDSSSDTNIEFEVVANSTSSKRQSTDGLVSDASVVTKIKGTNYSDVGSAIVGMVADAQEHGMSARLVYLWPGDEANESDYEVFELADDKNVPTFDLCQGMSRISFEDEGKPADEDGDEDDVPTEDELEQMSLDQLKRMAQRLGIETEANLKGRRKTTVIAMILAHDPSEVEEDEKPEAEPEEDNVTETATRSSRSRRADEDDGYDEDENEGGDEAQAVLYEGVSLAALQDSLPEHIQIASATRDLLRVAAADFAEMIVVAVANEVRRPKASGKPRADGTPAVPRAGRTRS